MAADSDANTGSRSHRFQYGTWLRDRGAAGYRHDTLLYAGTRRREIRPISRLRYGLHHTAPLRAHGLLHGVRTGVYATEPGRYRERRHRRLLHRPGYRKAKVG